MWSLQFLVSHSRFKIENLQVNASEEKEDWINLYRYYWKTNTNNSTKNTHFTPSIASLGVLNPNPTFFQNLFPPFPGFRPFKGFFELQSLTANTQVRIPKSDTKRSLPRFRNTEKPNSWIPQTFSRFLKRFFLENFKWT